MSQPLIPRVELPNGLVLPAETAQRMVWGDRAKGIAWLERLPDLIRDWCDRWDVALDPKLPEISYNLVLFGTTPTHGPVVIKTSPPHEEVTAEIEALRANQGPGLVKLLDADPTVSILLEERVIPGTLLRSFTSTGTLTDVDATEIAAECMKRYWSPAPENAQLFPLDRWFKSLYEYRQRFPAGEGPIPAELLNLAIQHTDHLLATEQERVILHGDLHHGNILRNEREGWTIIDPKGLVGERGYDIGQWMLNPYGLHQWPNLREAIETRLSMFTDLLGIDRYRIWQWALAHSVLSECWTLEGATVESDSLHALVITRILSEMPEALR